MYNFKKDIKVYVEYDGYIIPLDVYPDISFSQTFNESDYSKKTLHEPLNVYKGASIVEANTANFSFTTPIRYNKNFDIEAAFFGADYATGTIEPINIYIETTNKKFKLSTCVIEQLTFNIERASVFTVSVSGTASLLEEISVLPAVPQTQNTDPYTIIRSVKVQINGATLNSVAAINLEIANGIEWVRNTTLHASINNTLSYKNNYVLTDRTISGSITEFLLDADSGLPEYSTSSNMTIELASELGESPAFLVFNLPQVVYTRRLNIDEIINRVYDFRLLDNTVSVIPSIQGV